MLLYYALRVASVAGFIITLAAYAATYFSAFAAQIDIESFLPFLFVCSLVVCAPLALFVGKDREKLGMLPPAVDVIMFLAFLAVVNSFFGRKDRLFLALPCFFFLMASYHYKHIVIPLHRRKMERLVREPKSEGFPDADR